MSSRRFITAAACASAVCAAIAGGPVRVNAAALPVELAPPAPFPLVLAQSLEREFVAPGVERATYRLQTSAGPLVIAVVHVDPREPSVRFGTVLAHDSIVSAGESVSSMAARTNAVAGINADYFDIGNTNAPLGLFAHDGALLRTPSNRVALTVDRQKNVRFQTVEFHAGATVNRGATIAVTAVNEWPPHGGASLLTPDYGVPNPAPSVMLAELVPVFAGATPITEPVSGNARPAGTYRVSAIDAAGTVPARPVYALALGPAAQSGLATLPDVGDIIDVRIDADPSLDGVLQAVGGGPALLAAGVPIDDPASPGYAERTRRIPVAAAARLPDGDLLLAVIDGRHPQTSIGLARAELIALLTGFGAADAMQFDSGGSATLVARVLGDAGPTVLNEPSDGIERPVADGLFVYSDEPPGPPARLVIRPAAIEALPDTAIPLRAAIIDAAGHPLGPASGPWHVSGDGAIIDAGDTLHTAGRPQMTTLAVDRGGVRAELPVEIVAAPSRITISPDRPNPDPGATVRLQARAFDARGRPIETGDHVNWSALRGSIDRDGTFTAGANDGFVTAAIGDVRSSEIVHVGRHDVPLPGFDTAGQAGWHLETTPSGGPGTLGFTPQGTLQLQYDFRDTERAAYASAGIALGEPLALSCAIDGDANGAAVRVAFVDRYGERGAVTLARTIDWRGLQRHSASVPRALAPPIVLQSFYVVGSLATAPVKAAGTIGIRACELTVPGTAPTTP